MGRVVGSSALFLKLLSSAAPLLPAGHSPSTGNAAEVGLVSPQHSHGMSYSSVKKWTSPDGGTADMDTEENVSGAQGRLCDEVTVHSGTYFTNIISFNP